MLQKLPDANNNALEMEAKKPVVTAKAVREKIKPSVGISFFTQAEEYLHTLKIRGKYNIYTSEKPRIGHFKAFLKNQDIAFTDMTPGILLLMKFFLNYFFLQSK